MFEQKLFTTLFCIRPYTLLLISSPTFDSNEIPWDGFSLFGLPIKIPGSERGLASCGKWDGNPANPRPANPPNPDMFGRRLKLISLLSLVKNGLDIFGQLLVRAVARVVVAAMFCCWASCKLCQRAAECSCAFRLSSATLAPKTRSLLVEEFSRNFLEKEPTVVSSPAASGSFWFNPWSAELVFASGETAPARFERFGDGERSGRRGGKHGQGNPDKPVE